MFDVPVELLSFAKVMICMTHHDSDSVMHQGGRSIQTGGVFTHIQSGPGKEKRVLKTALQAAYTSYMCSVLVGHGTAGSE